MKFNEENLRCLLALNRLTGKGLTKCNKILDLLIKSNISAEIHTSSSKNQFPIDHQQEKIYINQIGQQEEIHKILQEKANKETWLGVDLDLEFANKPDCHILTRWDDEYPPLLNEIRQPPMILFVHGDVKRLKNTQIAMVGSRNASHKGREIAYSLAEQFSAVGVSVTSGLALGIDAASHQGALKYKGGTIAVLGNGLDQIYPSKHQKLAMEILENGALVSEFSLGVKPVPPNFPRRNRIISGLSLGTLVVEAAIKSGSLITAKFALDQDREVFAVPGSIHSQLAQGCHLLIREGAKLVETAKDVLEELIPRSQLGLGRLASLAPLDLKLAQLVSKSFQAKPQTKSLLSSEQQTGVSVIKGDAKGLLSSEHQTVLSVIEEDVPLEMDKIVSRCRLTAHEVSIMLLELELQGLVASVPGGFIRL